MIQLLVRSQKNIALLLITIFYAEFVMAGYTRIRAYQEGIYQSGTYLPNSNSGTEKTFYPGEEELSAADDTYQGGGYANGRTTADSLQADEDKDEDFSGGPTQPEMQAFQSVNNANMVDLFTGDFSYNIPLMDVGGYPINISYRSGISMDQEASWVGLGWNINPGTITRNMRGLPDDFNGGTDTITKTNSIYRNKTIGVTAGANLEVIGYSASGVGSEDPSSASTTGGDTAKKSKSLSVGLNVGGSLSVFHNTYHGWGVELGLDASVRAGVAGKGSLTGGLSVTDNSQYGLTATPSLSVQLAKNESADKGSLSGSFTTSFSYNSRSGIKSLDLSAGVRQYRIDIINQPSFSSSISFATPSYVPSISMPYTSTQYSFTGKAGLEQWALAPNFFVTGYVSKQEIRPEDQVMKLPAYGYLNYQNSVNNPSVLLDYNREKEIPYRENPPVPNIAIPSYTFDVFSITGEGTGGMFRPYRGDIGFVYDHYIKTKDASDKLSVDLGFFNVVHAGIDLNLNSSYTQNSPWTNQNPLANTIAFRNADSTFENVYFKNPGEKSINSTAFYDAVGGDDVVTAGLYQPGNNNPFITTTNYLSRYRNKTFVGTSLLTSANAIKTKRDKRTQVITYLNAADAALLSLSKNIENYAYNTYLVDTCNGSSAHVTFEDRVTSYRKASHISEIDVLNADGRRYSYGIPVYNFRQKEVTFAVNAANGSTTTGLVKYSQADASTGNMEGQDRYFSSEETPAYAHSFLLTGVLSPDYVDLTGDGISDDDLGDAVKFNYTKVAGSTNPFKWRTPYTNYREASYNEGLKTDNRDDKGSYVYGEKELWYLNTIQSKTMIATFTLEGRKDLLPIDENGNKDTTNNGHNGSKLLREINLYTKADYLKNGNKAIPIKTVHFEYDYTLCLGVNVNQNDAGSYGSYPYKDSGKLTLKKIWFTYNDTVKTRVLNPYIFHYHTNNPGYNSKYNDRWGNYKPQSQNPNAATNAEYPYALQDSANANDNAAAWTLDSIVLPSAGRIKVDYESDDYAYVQNKRAMQMFHVMGFASNIAGAPAPKLYTQDADNLYVMVRSSKALTSKRDLYYKYLEGVQKLFFKLVVPMPSDKWGSGSEYIPCYADIDTGYNNGGFGLIDANRFWIKMKGISLAGDEDGGYSPLAKAAIQYLRLNLPSKAYPGSDVGDDLELADAVKMILSLGTNITGSLTSFDGIARGNNWAGNIDTLRTIVRLDNPDFKRLGGGLRVKQITIYDHWNTMTGQKESKYGQKYDYTTIKEINGIPTRISSGVASYEPMIGGEENPFHVPLRYAEQSAPLAPVTLGYVEEPLGESFFPSAGVGYSKVRVRSINTVNRKSANGYEETAFYTAYDFPTLVDNSMLDGNTKKRYKPAIANFLHIDAKHYITLSQGFKVELNDMHGKMKYQATYPETDSANPISYTENFYRVDNPNVEFKHLSNTVTAIDEKGNVDTTAVVGKDVEIMMDMREQQSVVSGNNASVNTDLFLVGLAPIGLPSLWYLPQHEEDLYRSAATTKIVQRYGILDSVLHIEKGSRVSTRNLAYDSETGDVLLTRTSNEFNDPIFNFTYPAHWAYSGMGLAYKNIQAVFTGVTVNNGVLQASGKYPNLKNYFESGDEVLAKGRLKTGDNPVVNCDGVQTACSNSTYAADTTTSIIWAINAKKIDPSSPVSITFVDKDGNAYCAQDVSMKIIRSGKRNMAMTPVGSVASLINPLRVVSGNLQLVLDSTDNIIATGAVVFNDFWKVADRKISHTIDNTCTCGPLKILFDYLIASGRLFIHAADGVTVESLVNDAQDAGYAINIDDCGILKTNANGLFYATTSSSVGTLYSANIGTGVINISSNDSRTIHFYGLQSTSCLGDNKVHYRDASKFTKLYAVFNHTDVTQTFEYNDCGGSYIPSIPPQNHTSCFNALPGNIFIHTGLSIDSTNSCSVSQIFCTPDTTGITLEIQSCDDCATYACNSVVTGSTTNPYSAGIYGNWRTDRSYVYYGQRSEKNPSSQTDIRKNGVINGFVPFWSFGSAYLQLSTDTTRWVWNAQTTLFNKKGFELENKDPLGRYNSGRYGYSNSLPISVTQNSKYREQFFDGFEDYYYKDQNCTAICLVPREADFTQSHGVLDTVNRHSGKYSLKIAGHDSAAIILPVTTITKDTASQKLTGNFNVRTDTVVLSKGHGLTITNVDAFGHPSAYGLFVQATTTGSYTIKAYINGNGGGSSAYQFELGDPVGANNGGAGDTVSYTMFLYAGVPHSIHVAGDLSSYFTGPLTLKWQKCDISERDIPTANLYGAASDTVGSMIVNNDCSKFTGLHTDSSSLIPAFSPLQGSKMWFSGWVKEERTCLCQNYDSNQVKLVFLNTAGTGIDSVIARPSGTIIEGWQRYDYVFTVPANAAAITYKLMATGTTNVYFDDLRLHPFNANMKSFVYNPINLRLMAELDENNYATFYEYDDDGTLIRVKKETQRGIQTIKETRSYLTKYSNQ